MIAVAIVLSMVSAGASVYAADAYSYKDVIFRDVAVNGGNAIVGADISSVIALEKSGIVFKNKSGIPQDIFLTLKNSGVNYIRVRVWNNPSTADGQTYGGGANDVDTAVKIAERCQKYGLSLLVDFHYSDFWADPGKQRAPKAWQYYSVDQKADAIQSFTSDSLKKIAATGVKIGMVQVGNETTTGMCGETNWQNICRLMNAGAKAIRNFDRDILVAVHFTNPDKTDWFYKLADYLNTYKVDYDVFATSYYPFWHGTPANLTSVLKNISGKYNKYVMVAETSWVNSFDNVDETSNNVANRNDLGKFVSYDVGVQGQIDAVSDVFRAVADVGPKGLGAFYWEPAWLAVGTSYMQTLPVWERDGSGWATKYAGEFDEDAGKYYGGSSWENQALFAADGRPLESLDVFSHIITEKSDGSVNIISNPGFEDDNAQTAAPKYWKIENTTSGEYSKFEINSEMTRSGKYAAHWYSPEPFEYSGLYAEYTAPETGKYEFSTYIAGEKNIYKTLISINGEHKASADGETVSYDIWEKPVVKFTANAGDKIGIWIEINGQSGAYGSVDDCALYFRSAEISNPQPENPPEIKYEKGDVDTDGSVNANDLLCLIRYMTGISENSSLNDSSLADMNDDGIINIADLILLKNRILR